jgi:hypothetical protein
VETVMPLYICSMPNKGEAGPIRELISDDPKAIEEFAQREDKPGRAVYDCVNPLKPGAQRRCLETVGEIVGLRIDIDGKDIVEDMGEVDKRLASMPILPAEVRNSGHGRHVDIRFKEAISADDAGETARANDLLKRLTNYLCGDMSVAHPAALLRHLGTHNSKDGGWIEVDYVMLNDAKYDPFEIEDWLNDVEAKSLFTRLTKKQNTAADGEHKGPVNIPERLTAMRFKGAGETAIHPTQLSVTASMLCAGVTVDDAVAEVLQATRDAAGKDPRTADWDWAHEQRCIQRMCFDYINKHPDLSELLPEPLRTAFEAALVAGKRAKISRNAYGLHVRTYSDSNNAGAAREESKAKDNSGAAGNGKSGEAKSVPPKEPKFKLLRYCDLRPGMADQDYRVDELLPMEGLAMVWGKFKCLKTFWVYDLMLHIAKGWEYRDRAVRQGLVIYCAFEGAHGFRKRTEAQRRHYKLPDDDDVPLRVMSAQVNLIKEHRVFIADISQQLGKDETPAVVVLDTLNRSLVGSESKDIDMASYIAAASAIRETFKCLVVIVHHCGWDESRPRGHSSLPGAIDAQLAVVRDGDKVTVLVEFIRDGPEGAEIHSETKLINVGENNNGKPLTSLVVLPSEVAARKDGGWPDSLVVFRRAMKTALERYGETYRESVLDPPVQAVSINDIRQEFYAVYIPKTGQGEKEENVEQRQEAKKRAFSRSLEKAQKSDLIQCREPEGKPMLVWFSRHSTTWAEAS